MHPQPGEPQPRDGGDDSTGSVPRTPPGAQWGAGQSGARQWEAAQWEAAQWEAAPPSAPHPPFAQQPPVVPPSGPAAGGAWTGGGFQPAPPSAAPAWVPEQPTRVRREVRAPALALMLAGLLAAIGSFAPWVHVTQSGSTTALDGLDYVGLLTVVPAFVVIAVGALLYVRTVLGLSVTALACGSAMTLLCVVSFYPANWISEAGTALGDASLGSFDAGASWGLWLTFVGALGIMVAGGAAVLRGIWLVPAGSATAMPQQPHGALPH